MRSCLALFLLVAAACTSRRAVAPVNPPAGVPGLGWVDLRPGMVLRIENAYYRPGSTERVIANYLGTEAASFRVQPDGSLLALPLESTVEARPKDQPSAGSLLRRAQQRRRHHRFFFQVLFRAQTGQRTAVLLSSRSGGEMEGMTARLLSDPTRVCGLTGRTGCAVFPSTATASLGVETVVNGVPRVIPWSSRPVSR